MSLCIKTCVLLAVFHSASGSRQEDGDGLVDVTLASDLTKLMACQGLGHNTETTLVESSSDPKDLTGQCKIGTEVSRKSVPQEGGLRNSISPEESHVVGFYFVRHAESEWNKYKNEKKRHEKATPSIWVTMGRGISKLWTFGSSKAEEEAVKETVQFKERPKSDFIDAELSKEGLVQVQALRDEITASESKWKQEFENHRQFLAGLHRNDDDVAFATSNLRRAAMTLMIAFERQVLDKIIKKVKSLSDLQEISAGEDAQTLAGSGSPPALALDKVAQSTHDEKPNQTCPFEWDSLTDLFAAECNAGDKDRTNGTKRIKRFCNWMNHESFEDGKKDFVVVGHSAWLQDFFVHYLGGEVSDINLYPTIVSWPIRWQRIFYPKGINEAERSLLDVSGKKKLSNAGVLYTKVKLTGDNCEILVGKTEILRGEVKESGAE